MVAERKTIDPVYHHVVLIVPVEDKGVTTTVGDPSPSYCPVSEIYSGIDASMERRRQQNYIRNTTGRRR